MKIEFDDSEGNLGEPYIFNSWKECATHLAKYWLNGEIILHNSNSNTNMKLREYQCQSCYRFFYINPLEKSNWDMDFGCPYGCDDAGMLVREIVCLMQTSKGTGEKND